MTDNMDDQLDSGAVDAPRVYDSLIEQVAEALCGASGARHNWNDSATKGYYRGMARAARAVIAAHPRYELVELPESRPSGIVGQIEWGVESRRMPAAVTIRHDGLIADNGVCNPYANPGDARSHAAALLSAARAVERAE